MIYNLVAEQKGWDGFKQNLEDALLLEACILEAGNGDYLEIGVRMGGSAIFAALVKRAAKQTGDVYGIDRFGDEMIAKGVTPGGVLQRAALNGVDIRLTIANSNPWPLPDVYPVVALIDGGHSYQTCLTDWNNLKDRTKRFILFHDYKPGGSVAGAVEEARHDLAWKCIGSVGIMAAFERYHKAE